MKKNDMKIIILATVVIALLWILKEAVIHEKSFISEKTMEFKDKIISEVYLDKGTYSPGEKIGLTIELKNNTEKSIIGDIEIQIKYLGEEIKNKKISGVEIALGEMKEIEEFLDLKGEDFKGYLCEVLFRMDDETADFETTAIDVSSDWTRFPRYGYVSSFDNEVTGEIDDVIERLNRYHINGIQFYDWQNKHQDPIAKDENGDLEKEWIEIANRKINRDVVKAYIEKGHERNMAAMNYNLLFGAWSDYEDSGVDKEWGLFKDKKGKNIDYHPLPDDWASNKIYLFDPGNEGWQKYIFNKEREVFDYLDFDGWHIDQLGDRGYLYNSKGKILKLEKSYKSFFEAMVSQFPEKKIVFNAVNGFGQKELAESNAGDFLYVEVWDTDSFHRLKYFIDNGNKLSGESKNVVIAGYMNYKAQNRAFNEHSVKLANATIFASGGAHIEIGDSGMLSHEYFPNKKLWMSETLERDMIEYYDFLVAYQNILRDGVKEKKVEIQLEGFKTSERVQKETVWNFAKEKEDKIMIHLINLLQSKTRNWRDDNGTQVQPELLENVEAKVYINEKIKGVSVASPDFQDSRMRELDFENGKDENGKFIRFTLPQFQYWDMIVIQK